MDVETARPSEMTEVGGSVRLNPIRFPRVHRELNVSKRFSTLPELPSTRRTCHHQVILYLICHAYPVALCLILSAAAVIPNVSDIAAHNDAVHQCTMIVISSA